MLEEYCPDVEFRELRARLFEETEMVARKKGATGTLVTVNRIHAHHSETIKRRKYCLLRDYALCSPHDDAAAEFWGKAPGFPSMDDIGYVSGTWRFPWMTTDISEEYD